MKNKESNSRAVHTMDAIAILLGIVFIGIGIFAIIFALPDFKELTTDSAQVGENLKTGLISVKDALRDVILSFAGVLGGTVIIVVSAIHIVLSSSENKTDKRLAQFESTVEAELKRGISVRDASGADNIWLNCTRMLNDLTEKGYAEHRAYDVTTYFNKLRYEEMVARCLEHRVRFHRVFCYRFQNKQPSDELMQWYLTSIQSGRRTTLSDLRNRSFMRDLLLAFKEHEDDPILSEITDREVERLNKIINVQWEAMSRGILTIVPLERRMPFDFIVTEYVSQPGGSPEYEVQANFKTMPLMETYVAGTYATGAAARHYQELFVNIIEPGIL